MKKHFFFLIPTVLLMSASGNVWGFGGGQKKIGKILLKKVRFIGNLVKNSQYSVFAPDRYCIFPRNSRNGKGIQYKGFDYRMGSLNIYGISSDLLEKHRKYPAVEVSGVETQDLTRVITNTGSCSRNSIPVMQLRSDWESPECGNSIQVTTMSKLRTLSYLNAKSIKKTEYMKFSRGKSFLTVKFRNIFGISTKPMGFHANYESYPGKPSKTVVSHTISSLRTNKVSAHSIPLKIKKHGKTYRLNTISQEGELIDISGNKVVIRIKSSSF
ncbi:MAG: hypothetical protein JXR95_09765 [Deltaproteobacteria bacterium]|nr:hypothetical protein [Deltaproteobacteria bacterium]